VAAHAEAVAAGNLTIDQKEGFHGAALRVRNYILGISESSGVPVEEVQESLGVRRFAESLSVDIDRVKFRDSEEE
jgi:hypothetical protein